MYLRQIQGSFSRRSIRRLENHEIKVSDMALKYRRHGPAASPAATVGTFPLKGGETPVAMALEATQVVNGTEILLGRRRCVFKAVRIHTWLPRPTSSRM